MKGSTRAAVAVGVGYVLGRRRKLRTAALLAATTAVGSTPMGSMLVKRGARLVASSGALDTMAPQVGEIIEVVRGDLLDAGKAAASAAVSSKVDSLTSSLHDRAEQLRDPQAVVSDAAGAAGSTARGAAGGAREAAGTASGRARRRGGSRRDEDEYEDEPRGGQDAYEDEEYDEDEGDYDEGYDAGEEHDGSEEPGQSRRRPARRRPVVSRTRR